MEQDMEMLMHMDKALLSLIMGLTGYLLGSVMFAYPKSRLICTQVTQPLMIFP